MSNQPPPIDYSTAAPEVQRLAEEVQASQQPRAIQKDGKTIAVVTPVAPTRTRRHSERSPTEADRQAALATFGGGKGTGQEVSTMERDELRRRLFAPVSAEEIARRQAVMKRILANQARRHIAPVTSTELVREVREEASQTYDDQR